jgi:hypothetical protein
MNITTTLCRGTCPGSNICDEHMSSASFDGITWEIDVHMFGTEQTTSSGNDPTPVMNVSIAGTKAFYIIISPFSLHNESNGHGPSTSCHYRA